MKIECSIFPNLISVSRKEKAVSVSKREKIIKYYEKAGPDYYAWSKEYNMHFGYYQRGMNPFAREAMLEKLNKQVFERLQLNSTSTCTCVDFGCGLGATLRYGSKHFPRMTFKGITLVPWQVAQAKELNIRKEEYKAIDILEGDYCKTHFEANSIDAIVAIESSCYASGESKSDLLNEVHRVLKPGGRFVIADGFVKKSITSSGFLHSVYNQLCSSWALTELGNINAIEEYLRNLKFTNVTIEDVSLHIAPSVAHVPLTVLSFLLKEYFFGKESMSKERWDNLKSPLLTMILGLARSYFGYYFVSGTKANENQLEEQS